MSNEEVIGTFVNSYNDAKDRYHQAHAELTIWAERAQKLADALQLDAAETILQALPAAIPTMADIQPVLTRMSVAKTQMDNAKGQLIALRVPIAD